MSEFRLDAVSIEGFRAFTATHVDGQERKLVEAVLDTGCDVVFLPGASPASLAKLERTGLPCRPASRNGFDSGLADAARQVAPGEDAWVLLPMLHRSLAPVQERVYRVEPEDVVRYAEGSGDTNALHFDDEFARSLGFEGRISHGMLFNGWISRFLGTEYPGKGTIFLQNATCYFAPVYPSRDYAVRISTPWQDLQKGLYRIVVQIASDEGGSRRKLAMLSFNDVLRRPAA